jgi:hypothetical protein
MFQTLFTNTVNMATQPIYNHAVMLRSAKAMVVENEVLDIGNNALEGRRSIEARRLATAQQRLYHGRP